VSKRTEIRARRKREQNQRRLIAIIIVVGAALILTAILIAPNFAPIGEIAMPILSSYPMVDGTAMGDPGAPVLIEEFSDFQCSYCRVFHESTHAAIADAYVATGKARIVFRNYPVIGPESLAAANASMCAAEQDKFWEFSSILFANQNGHDTGAFSTRRLEAFAGAINLNVGEFSACLREARYQGEVQEDIRAGILGGVDSTPSFLVNGVLMVGALPYETFQAEIESALSTAPQP
jgi:protein-disulfide isomerase